MYLLAHIHTIRSGGGFETRGPRWDHRPTSCQLFPETKFPFSEQDKRQLGVEEATIDASGLRRRTGMKGSVEHCEVMRNSTFFHFNMWCFDPSHFIVWRSDLSATVLRGEAPWRFRHGSTAEIPSPLNFNVSKLRFLWRLRTPPNSTSGRLR